MRSFLAALILTSSFALATPAVAQAEHSGVVLCLRPVVAEGSLVNLFFVNVPGGSLPAQTQVLGLYMSDGVACPS